MGVASLPKNKFKFFLGLVAFLLTAALFYVTEPKPPVTYLEATESNDIEFHLRGIDKKKIEEWWTLRNSTKNLSKLGEVLFLDSPEPEVSDSNKIYRILVWKYGSTIENRHLKHFTAKRIDPFEYCPVKNCDITYSDGDLETADIVIFHLHRIKGLDDMPETRNRIQNQIWAFLTDESPHHTFMSSKNALKDFNGLFNWSMSYRMDTDIPVPYGRTIVRKPPGDDMLFQVALNKKRDVLVAILGSNCGGQNHRWQYVKELQKYIDVDVYGSCGPLKKECPGHFGADCPAINDYLFYLAFENSNCDEYVTEKLWWNAYEKNSIPVVMGSSPDTYKKLLPVNSYINTEDFANPQALAQYLLRLNKTEEFKEYYRWRSAFEVANEHGYFKSKSYHFCRICQAMNYNSKEAKVYDDLESFWTASKYCHPPWDSWSDK